jgi:hypothetical protein
MTQKWRWLWCALGLIMVSAWTGRVVLAQPPVPLRLTAFAVDMSTVGAGNTGTVDITISRWSTDAERDKLLSTFLERGPEKVLEAVQDAKPVGRVGGPGNVGWELRFARYQPLPEGGSQITLLTDRPIGFWEARNQPRTAEYPFTLIELRLKPGGTGEGKASVATKITYNRNTKSLELENYTSEPIRLNNVKVQTR